jgi:hypothetical protein
MNTSTLLVVVTTQNCPASRSLGMAALYVVSRFGVPSQPPDRRA